jgi:hypothetical protein
VPSRKRRHSYLKRLMSEVTVNEFYSMAGVEDDLGAGGLGGQTAGGALLERETQELVEPGDHERYSHYVRKEKIVESAVLGVPVTALCGKVWVPGRDPQKFPVCPICKEIYDGLRPEHDDSKNGKGGGNGGGDSGSGGSGSGSAE